MIKFRRFCKLLMMAIFMVSSAGTAQWTPQPSPLPTGVPAHFFYPVNQNIVWAIGFTEAGPSQDVLKTVDGGKTWQTKTIIEATGLWFDDIFASDSSTAWVSAFDFNLSLVGGIFKTTDGGKTWVRQPNLYDRSGTAPLCVYFFDKKDGLAIGDSPADGYFEIYTTVNGGDNWTRVPKDSIPALLAGGEFSVNNSYAAQGNSFWFGTFPGRVSRTTNRGKNWAVSDPGLSPNTVVFLAFQDENNGLATRLFRSRNRLAKTTDGGKTWTELTSLPNMTGPVKFIPGTKETYIIGSTNDFGQPPGSAYTLDGGVTWKVIDNIPHTVPAFVSPRIGWVGGGNFIYKWAGPAVSVAEARSELPTQFALNQNYPNPFNPTTTIAYHLPRASQVKLIVYNLAGQLVRTLVEAQQSAGRFQINWDGKDEADNGVASGVYLYRLEAGNFAETKKMILMR